jgi:putative endonuclease
MSFFVYILQNYEGRFYIGHTNDLIARLRRHNEGAVFWTKSRGPWKPVYSREFKTRSEAMMEELRLKRLKSKKAIETFIAQSVESLLRRKKLTV